MKNKLLTIALTAACCLTYIACDDNKDEFLDEFSTILSFRNCDEIEVEVYNTGENGEYQLIVNKSGTQLGTVTRDILYHKGTYSQQTRKHLVKFLHSTIK